MFKLRLCLLQGADNYVYYDLCNLVVLFLPAKTTSHIQPLDQGIISAFKAYYRRHLVNWTVAQYDVPDDKWDGVELSKIKPNFQQMLTWAKQA